MHIGRVIVGNELKSGHEEYGKKQLLAISKTLTNIFVEVIVSFDEVERVEDVSERNLGYDVLAVLKNGKNSYYELKSVD